ncbi:phenylacetate--CoA ligase, partial [Burkholderia diffusa]
QALREEVETRVGIDALDIYGLSEVMGPGVACECVETKDGPVIWEDHFYPEIIDPVTGEVLPDGSQGELVFTSLTKEAMPVIRYRTRDLTALLPPTARTMRRLAKITGRSDDMLIVRGVNVFPSQVEEIVVALPQLSGQFQITLSRDGHMDRLDLAVELRSEAAASVTESDRAALARELQHRIKTMVGVSSGVTVLAAGGIPASATGKARRVIDCRHAA